MTKRKYLSNILLFLLIISPTIVVKARRRSNIPFQISESDFHVDQSEHREPQLEMINKIDDTGSGVHDPKSREVSHNVHEKAVEKKPEPGTVHTDFAPDSGPNLKFEKRMTNARKSLGLEPKKLHVDSINAKGEIKKAKYEGGNFMDGKSNENPKAGNSDDGKSNENPKAGNSDDEKSNENSKAGNSDDEKSNENPKAGNSDDGKSNENSKAGNSDDGKSNENSKAGNSDDGKSNENPEAEKSEGRNSEDEKSKDEKPEDEKSEDEKSEDKKSEDKKSEDKKSEDKKSKDEKSEDEKSKDEKPEDKKPEDEKPEDKKSEDKKSKDEKSEDKKSKDEKSEDKKPEDKKSKDEKPEDKKSKDEKPEDKKPEDKKPEDEKPEDKKSKDEKPEHEKSEDEKSESEKSKDKKSKDEKPEHEKSEDEKSESEKSKDEKSEIEKPEAGRDTILYNGEDCSDPEKGHCVSGAECKNSFCICSHEGSYGKECIQADDSFFAKVVTPEITGKEGEQFIGILQRAQETLKSFEDLMTLKLGEACDSSLSERAEAVVMYFAYRDSNNGIETEHMDKELATADQLVTEAKHLCNYREFLKCQDEGANHTCTYFIPGVVKVEKGPESKTLYWLDVGQPCFKFPRIFDPIVEVQCAESVKGNCSRENPGICKEKCSGQGQDPCDGSFSHEREKHIEPLLRLPEPIIGPDLHHKRQAEEPEEVADYDEPCGKSAKGKRCDTEAGFECTEIIPLIRVAIVENENAGPPPPQRRIWDYRPDHVDIEDDDENDEADGGMEIGTDVDYQEVLKKAVRKTGSHLFKCRCKNGEVPGRRRHPRFNHTTSKHECLFAAGGMCMADSDCASNICRNKGNQKECIAERTGLLFVDSIYRSAAKTNGISTVGVIAIMMTLAVMRVI